MKITPKQYAQALFELTEGKTESEISAIISSFSKKIIQNRDVSLMAKIIENFASIWNGKNNIVEAEITIANELNEDLKERLLEMIREKYRADEVSAEFKIDKSIKGGARIKVGDEMMDSSIERQLKDLKKQLFF